MRRLSILALITAVAGVISAGDCARGGNVDPNDQARADSIRKAKRDSGKTDTTHIKHATVPTTPPK